MCHTVPGAHYNQSRNQTLQTPVNNQSPKMNLSPNFPPGVRGVSMRLWKCFVEVMSLHLPTSSRVITATATSGSVTPRPSSAIKEQSCLLRKRPSAEHLSNSRGSAHLHPTLTQTPAQHSRVWNSLLDDTNAHFWKRPYVQALNDLILHSHLMRRRASWA